MRPKLLPLKRRGEEKTNYKRRLALLKSKMPRIAARITNNFVTLQVVEYAPSGAIGSSDKTTFAFTSKKLEGMGWKHSKNSIPACYLSGLYFGLFCKKNKVKGAVFDMGVARKTTGNRYFAVLKGLADSGLEVPMSDEKMPSDDRLSGRHISEDVSKDFEAVKQKILDNYGK
ncbi:MAG: 50S ribosomal protein L18 [Candidatus Aenigmarchaeota archaeon]|nr:50S ribosomal protein L18 [Candidatus Aenigmarchaeota archaeon]